MAEEPRRSGRATKGQHTKMNELAEAMPVKRKGKAQSKAQKQTSSEPTPTPEEDEEEVIRCVCGKYEEEEDVERDMICCDQCGAWQHNDCMGLEFPKGSEPDQYFCERCKPENHKVLLEAMARGEKPWEDVEKRRMAQFEEKKARRKKGGRRGKKTSSTKPTHTKSPSDNPGSANPPYFKSPSEAPASTNPPDAESPSETPASTNPPDNKSPHESATRAATPSKDMSAEPLNAPDLNGPGPDVSDGPSSGQKRKLDEEPEQENGESPKAKQPKVTVNSPEARKFRLDSLSSARRNVAHALMKLFVDQAEQATRQGSFQVPSSMTPNACGEELGLEAEEAMYRNLCGGTGEPNESYKQQMRTILFNVRKNPSLRDSLLVGSTSADRISTMSTQDMASQELKQRDDQIKRESERQHTIIQERGPRIRRTHKGEELVEDDVQVVANESIFSRIPRRDTKHGVEGSMSPVTGKAPSPPATRQPEFGPDYRAPSPSHHDQQFGPAPTMLVDEPMPLNKAPVDAEIDNLLQDEENEEPYSPPYSPKEYTGEDDVKKDKETPRSNRPWERIVWQGRISMNNVSEFPAMARHVGGADLSSRIPWTTLIPPTLNIVGRISVQLASNYLCGLRFSQTTDVSVTAVSAPSSPVDHAAFDHLFAYFADREKYGVIAEHADPAVKDVYLIPIAAGPGTKPDFLELLENNAVPDPSPERLLLVVFVIRSGRPSISAPSSAQQTPSDNPLLTGTPLSATLPTAATPIAPEKSPFNASKAPVAQASPPQQQQQQQSAPLQSSYGLGQQTQNLPLQSNPNIRVSTPTFLPPASASAPSAITESATVTTPLPLAAPATSSMPATSIPQTNSTTYTPTMTASNLPGQPTSPNPVEGPTSAFTSTPSAPPTSTSSPAFSATAPTPATAAAAAQVFGPLTATPAISQLLQAAPQADATQLKIVADVLARNPAAAADYGALMAALAGSMKLGGATV